MPNGQQVERPEPVEIDTKAELQRARINLNNTKFQVKIQEAIVKKLEKLAV